MHHTNRNDMAILVRLPSDLADALKQQADREDRSVASLVRVATRRYLAAANR